MLTLMRIDHITRDITREKFLGETIGEGRVRLEFLDGQLTDELIWRDCRDYISDYDILKFLPVI